MLSTSEDFCIAMGRLPCLLLGLFSCSLLKFLLPLVPMLVSMLFANLMNVAMMELMEEEIQTDVVQQCNSKKEKNRSFISVALVDTLI